MRQYCSLTRKPRPPRASIHPGPWLWGAFEELAMAATSATILISGYSYPKERGSSGAVAPTEESQESDSDQLGHTSTTVSEVCT